MQPEHIKDHNSLKLAKIRLRNAEERHARLMKRLLQLHLVEFESFQKLHAQHTDRRSLPRSKTGHFDIVNGFSFVEQQEQTIQQILGATGKDTGQEPRTPYDAIENDASYIEYKKRNEDVYNLKLEKMCLEFDERLLKTRVRCMEEIVDIKKEIKDSEKSLKSSNLVDSSVSSPSSFLPSPSMSRLNPRDPRLRRQSPDVPGAEIQR